MFPSDSTEQTLPRVKIPTVTELTQLLRGAVDPAFSNVWVRGEVSNYKKAASGHVYFSLKDAQSMISAAAFGWERRKVKFELEEGLEVICHGKISIYPPRGSYQIVVDHVEPVGAGALQLAYEQLKAKLAQEGLFDSAKKRPLPKYPKKIAVVTSPSGAAIRDVLNVLGRRAPHVEVVIVPALVQGDQAAEQLVRALGLVARHQLGQVILLTRGGGAMEDLWCFNDEALARAIRSSPVPVVSAVGHEVDFTIADFVADLRAPTPSAGAEILSQNWVQLRADVELKERALTSLMQRELKLLQSILAQWSARLVSPKDRLREQMQRLDESFLRMIASMDRLLDRRRASFESLAGKLSVLSPLQVLERGFTIVREPGSSGRILKRTGELKNGQKIEITFQDGVRQAEVLG